MCAFPQSDGRRAAVAVARYRIVKVPGRSRARRRWSRAIAVVSRRIVKEDHSRQPQKLRVPHLRRDEPVERLLVDRGEEACDIKLERPCPPSPVGRHPSEETHQPVARSERPLAPPTGKRVVDEDRLEDALLVGDQKVVNNPIPEVSREDLAWLGALRDEADGSPRLVGVLPQLALEHDQVRLRIDLEGKGIQCVPLVAAAVSVLPPQLTELVEVRADHEPPRTART